MKFRIESDSLGKINVPANKLWGAQTQRSLENFKISSEKIPLEIIYALAHIKKACAEANLFFKKLDQERCNLIIEATDRVISREYDDNFPLSVWQTGSGTQSNMNVNEVISNLCKFKNPEIKVHPNDHVNMSQSSNDTFPTAMRIAAIVYIENKLLPSLDRLIASFKDLELKNREVIKIGRTHLQDAVPIGFWQEISGWRNAIEVSRDMIKSGLKFLRKIAIGATAVGTGLNSPKNFDKVVCEILSKNLKISVVPDENKFHALAYLDAFVIAHGALKSLAANLMKIANDIRWLSSGPRCGLGEIKIPQNEPGSSIMPGKVNPTQCEAITMIAVQVMGNDTAIGVAASQGNFELNVFLPVCIHNFMNSLKILNDGILSFEEKCIRGIQPIKEKMFENLNKSLMLVTALSSRIGYENSAKVAKKAYEENLSVKDAALSLKLMSSAEIDQILDPNKMV
ncbi:MAG: class II fumarate hydratase [Acutalibacteraceae bacterium]